MAVSQGGAVQGDPIGAKVSRCGVNGAPTTRYWCESIGLTPERSRFHQFRPATEGSAGTSAGIPFDRSGRGRCERRHAAISTLIDSYPRHIYARYNSDR